MYGRSCLARKLYLQRQASRFCLHTKVGKPLFKYMHEDPHGVLISILKSVQFYKTVKVEEPFPTVVLKIGIIY